MGLHENRSGRDEQSSRHKTRRHVLHASPPE
jgi:hypothetical protein